MRGVPGVEIAAFAAGGGSQTVNGFVKWFDNHKGYGFVTIGDGDVLLHQTCVRESGFRQVVEGASVTCEIARGPKGFRPCACCRWTTARPTRCRWCRRNGDPAMP